MPQENRGINLSELEFVYIGASKPTTEDFKPIENFNPETDFSNPSKPKGGLWASPIMGNGKSDWENWLNEKDPWTHKTNRDMFGLDDKKTERFYVVPKQGCRVLCIDDEEKIEPYLKKVNGRVVAAQHIPLIDYEALMKDFDAIYVSERHDDFPGPFKLWSTKTMLVGNLDAFDIQTESEHSRSKPFTNSASLSYLLNKARYR